MRVKAYAVLLVVAAVLAGLSGVAVADSGPLADAGLDQEVGVNTTVQLDGTGSTHPDGRIDGYEWSIETPDGRRIVPECADCARTRFTPRRTGRYDVTVTVTGGEGRSDGDTLYVYVDDGPTVELAGDTEPPTGEPTSYDATANASDAELERITWRIDNRTVAEESLDGTEGHSDRSFIFTDSRTRRLEVVVRDSENRTARDSLLVDPQDSGSESDSSPAEDPAPSSAESGPRTVERDTTDCINGVFVDGNAGCIGHISDDSHRAQSEGCEQEFCGVGNPARDSDTADDLSEDSGAESDRTSPELELEINLKTLTL